MWAWHTNMELVSMGFKQTKGLEKGCMAAESSLTFLHFEFPN